MLFTEIPKVDILCKRAEEVGESIPEVPNSIRAVVKLNINL